MKYDHILPAGIDLIDQPTYIKTFLNTYFAVDLLRPQSFIPSV